MLTKKELDIKINAVKRLTKEMKYRVADVETEEKRTEKLISQGEDQYTVRKQVLNLTFVKAKLERERLSLKQRE